MLPWIRLEGKVTPGHPNEPWLCPLLIGCASFPCKTQGTPGLSGVGEEGGLTRDPDSASSQKAMGARRCSSGRLPGLPVQADPGPPASPSGHWATREVSWLV